MWICIGAAILAVTLYASNARAHMTADCLYLIKTFVSEHQSSGEESKLPPDPRVFPDPNMNWVERFTHLLFELDDHCVWISDKNLSEIRELIEAERSGE